MTDAQIVGSNGLYGRYTLEGFLHAQKRLNRRKLALYPLPAHLWLDHIRCIGLKQLLQALEAEALSVVSFYPEYRQYSLFEGVDTLRGQCTMEYYRRCVDVAAALQSETICVYPAGNLLDGSPEREWKALTEHVSSLCEYAGRKKLTVCVQTVTEDDGRAFHRMEELARLLEQVPEACVALDTLPLSRADETISQWFNVFGSRIRHVCFRDGRASGGRIWGEGVCPSQRYAGELRRSGYTGAISIAGTSDRYWEAPEAADAKNLARVQSMLCTPKGGE